MTDNSTLEEIARAYRRVARKFHPDRNPEGAEKFREIEQAYQLLSDPENQIWRGSIFTDGVIALPLTAVLSTLLLGIISAGTALLGVLLLATTVNLVAGSYKTGLTAFILAAAFSTLLFGIIPIGTAYAFIGTVYAFLPPVAWFLVPIAWSLLGLIAVFGTIDLVTGIYKAFLPAATSKPLRIQFSSASSASQDRSGAQDLPELPRHHPGPFESPRGSRLGEETTEADLLTENTEEHGCSV